MSNLSFIGWSEPFLPQVAQKILNDGLERADRSNGIAPSLDLGAYAFVLTGRRAMRTLESYLQTFVEGAIAEGRVAPDWTPPAYVSLGELFERLYIPKRRMADELTRMCCMSAALDRLDSASRLLVLGAERSIAPDAADERFEIARPLLQLQDELASERVSFAKILDVVANDPKEAPKWKALRALNALYRSELDRLGLTDRNIARSAALDQGRVGGTSFDRYNGKAREYRVVGAVDLNAMQKDFFAALGDRVQYWVFAPESEKERFDPNFGSVVDSDFALPIEAIVPDPDPARPIPAKNFFQVDSPAEQGETVAALVCELATRENGRPLERESLTIGAPDPEPIPYIEQYLNKLGFETLSAEGGSVSKHRAYQTALDLVEYIDKRSFSALTSLVQRPEVGLFLARRWNGMQEREGAPEDFENVSSDELVDAFDRYRIAFHPTRVDGKWLQFHKIGGKENRDSEKIRRAAKIIGDLLADYWEEPYRDQKDETDASLAAKTERSGIDGTTAPLDALKVNLDASDAEARKLLAQGRLKLEGSADDGKPRQKSRSLKEWAPILSRTLCALYEEHNSRQDATSDRAAAIDSFFKAFNQTLDSFDSAPEIFAPLSGATAWRVALKLVGSKRLDPALGKDPVEIQGWLDLLFDDAPNLIVTGFNERVVPGARTSSTLISESLRKRLGMSGSERVVARDAYLTAALSHSRANAHFIFGRRSLEGEPRQPSRFVFAKYLAPSGETFDPIAERVCCFFGSGASDTFRNLCARMKTRADAAKECGVATSLDELIAKSARLSDERDKMTKLAKERQVYGLNRPLLDLVPKRPDDFDGENFPREISVTDFEAFLTSPYRYFLSKVFHLKTIEPPTLREMNAATFGTIAHEALREFGLKAIESGDDPIFSDERKLGAFLDAALERVAPKFFDVDNVSPFTRIQLEQIRWRLLRFAKWQAEWSKEGWRVKFVEKAPQNGGVLFDVGETPILIKGRIDRIDYNPKKNKWKVFDYKTFDDYKLGSAAKKGGEDFSEESEEPLYIVREGNTVDIKHRVSGPKDCAPPPLAMLNRFGICEPSSEEEYRRHWINLQLPLYRLLFAQILSEYYEGKRDVDRILSETKVSFGYIVLPKANEVVALGAPWKAIDWEKAESTARWVVRTLRRFWDEGVVNPFRDIVDDGTPTLRVLASAAQKFDDFEPLTFDYDPDVSSALRKVAGQREERKP